ncbi:hypothetical protein ASG25_21210 [Rhizobium sp. Leaf384]|nr:hypothetical protein ASG25_21210 [Rhizobium sp. Leaf384]KQS83962.1 hypothetical protein ASG58_21595 [Rhizobium sp. Leaf383]
MQGAECERHIHPLRVLECAENHGGRVVDTAGEPVNVELDEAAALRSRWRKAAYQCRSAHDEMDAREILCAAADCCVYSLPQVGSEFSLWGIQPTKAMVERLETAVSSLERRAA